LGWKRKALLLTVTQIGVGSGGSQAGVEGRRRNLWRIDCWLGRGSLPRSVNPRNSICNDRPDFVSRTRKVRRGEGETEKTERGAGEGKAEEKVVGPPNGA